MSHTISNTNYEALINMFKSKDGVDISPILDDLKNSQFENAELGVVLALNGATAKLEEWYWTMSYRSISIYKPIGASLITENAKCLYFELDLQYNSPGMEYVFSEKCVNMNELEKTSTGSLVDFFAAQDNFINARISDKREVKCKLEGTDFNNLKVVPFVAEPKSLSE